MTTRLATPKRKRADDPPSPLLSDETLGSASSDSESASSESASSESAVHVPRQPQPIHLGTALTDAAIDTALAGLAANGFCVIEGVLSEGECAAAFADVRAWFAAARIAIDDPALKMSSYPHVHGIMKHLGVGHSKAVWDVRQSESVTRVFERMHGDNDLLASFDGLCWMPQSFRDKGNTWLHVDQGHKAKRGRPNPSALCCIQGYVNLLTSHDDRSGSLVVVPGSHKRHAQFAAANPRASKRSSDWFKFNADELAQLGGEPQRVHGGVGSLVLWDSRTAHQASPPPPGGEARERCVVYVSMQPRALISAADLKRKQKAFDDERTTSHWAATNIRLNELTWRTYGTPEALVAQGKPPKLYDVVQPPTSRVVTPRMLELAGKTPLLTRKRARTTPALVWGK